MKRRDGLFLTVPLAIDKGMPDGDDTGNLEISSYDIALVVFQN